MSRDPVIAVVGATGAVGEAMLSILSEHLGYKCRLHALASDRSLGLQVEYGRKTLDIEVLEQFDFEGVDYALFSAGASVSREFAPRACAAGCIVIDNTSEFRYQDNIPLVVPEVNPEKIDAVGPGAIIANPNCSTIQLVVAIAPIHRAVGVVRINVATYQSVSGAGRKGMEELAHQTADRLSLREVKANEFAQPIAFNVLPAIDSMQENGYTREEMKMHWETRKILGDDKVMVNATAVRVPVFFGHSEAVHLETAKPISPRQVSRLLKKAPGVELVEAIDDSGLPTPSQTAGKDAVFVSRIRKDHSHERGINLWVVSDNLRKGAALNAVQIMEMIEQKRRSSGGGNTSEAKVNSA